MHAHMHMCMHRPAPGSACTHGRRLPRSHLSITTRHTELQCAQRAPHTPKGGGVARDRLAHAAAPLSPAACAAAAGLRTLAHLFILNCVQAACMRFTCPGVNPLVMQLSKE